MLPLVAPLASTSKAFRAAAVSIFDSDTHRQDRENAAHRLSNKGG